VNDQEDKDALLSGTEVDHVTADVEAAHVRPQVGTHFTEQWRARVLFATSLDAIKEPQRNVQAAAMYRPTSRMLSLACGVRVTFAITLSG
jgi:hypothetical protein